MFAGDKHQGLFWYVPIDRRHGPSGGHVRAQRGRRSDYPHEERPVAFSFYDILDFHRGPGNKILQGWWERYAMSLAIYSCGLLLTLAMLSLLEMWWLLWEASPKPRALRNKCRLHPATTNLWKAILVIDSATWRRSWATDDKNQPAPGECMAYRPGALGSWATNIARTTSSCPAKTCARHATPAQPWYCWPAPI